MSQGSSHAGPREPLALVNGGAGERTAGGPVGGGTDPLRPSPYPPDDESAFIPFPVYTDLANCLFPLLRALQWRGDRRHVAEALPHFADSFDLADLRNVMANLHYRSRPLRESLHLIDPRLYPLLFVPENGAALVALEATADGIQAFDGGSGSIVYLPYERLAGTAYIFTQIRDEDIAAVADPSASWCRTIGQRFTHLFYQSLGLTFLINLVGIANPIYVMWVYDKVIPTQSLSTLAFLTLGVFCGFLVEMVLRQLRVHIAGFMGGRLDNIFGIEIFKRILYLQPAFTEKSTVGSQITRIKDFESVREFFTGPIAGMLIEIPFIPVYIFIIFMLSGPLAYVPVAMILIFLAVLFASLSMVRRTIKTSGRSSNRRQELAVECLSKMQALKYTGTGHVWQERYRRLCGEAAHNDFNTSLITALVNTLAAGLMMFSGLITMSVGVHMVIGGSLSVGALVATMMLVWRLLGPFQTAFITMTRVEQVRGSIRQIDNLMRIKPERNPNARFIPVRRLKGRVTFFRVSLRYSANAEPALIGASFDAAPGEVVGIVGHNGSGKSTILKMICGIYLPQAGSIRIDDSDMRQFDPIEIRTQIAYAPQVCNLFYGTIAQNLRLANPLASDADILWAVEMAALRQDIEALPDGFETRLKSIRSGQLPTSFQQRLSLARAYVKKSPIMLFDEPGTGLDFEADLAFMEAIRKLRGHATIFIVTHRPSHLKVTDKVIWMDQGNVNQFGPTEQVLQKMPKGFL